MAASSNSSIRRRREAPILEILKIGGLSEFFSTFIFVFAGSGSVLAFKKITGYGGATQESLLISAVAHAFALFVAISCSAHVSGRREAKPEITYHRYVYSPMPTENYVISRVNFGGYVNPAVTFALFVGGNMGFLRGSIYITAQLLGSIVACLVLMFLTGGQKVPPFGLSAGIKAQNALVLEIVMTFELVYTVYAIAMDPKSKGPNQSRKTAPVKRRSESTAPTRTSKTTTGASKTKNPALSLEIEPIAPIAIGFFLGANILAFGPFDGACMNPAASFGPAVVNWAWANHWVYWVGPLIGGAIAALLYEVIFISKTHEPSPSDAPAPHTNYCY